MFASSPLWTHSRPAPARSLRAVVRLLVITVGLVLTAGLVVAQPAQADRVTERPVSPPGSLMVVDINMAEVFRAEDIADQGDVINFARRTHALLPYVPDIALVQEVNNVAAENVAAQLTRITGYRFAVAGPELGDTSIYEEGTDTTPRIVRESTVVVNLDTVELISTGPWVEFSYDPQYTDARFKWVTNSGAYVLVQEIDGGLRAKAASIHYQPSPRFDPIEMGYQYKGEWNQQIDRIMREDHPNPSVRQVTIVGGDFNARPCVGNVNLEDHPDCEPAAQWRVATEELGWEWAVPYGVDHIFSDGSITQSGSDRDWRKLIGDGGREDRLACMALYDEGRSDEATGGCADVYYTDHHLVWGLVGMRVPSDADSRP